MADVKKTAEEQVQYDPQYILQVKDLKKYFPIKGGMLNKTVGYVKAVDGVTFNLKRGTTMGLVGESGCGKTTCGRTCLGMYNKTDGQVLYRGKDVHALKGSELFAYKREAQMVFQDPYASLDPRMTVSDIIAEGMDVHHLYQNKAERAEKIYGLLEKVGLNKEHANRFIHEFSGGQRQRIGIARALASMVKHISDRVAVMYLGQIVEITRSEELYSHPLHPYTQALLSAIPIPDPIIEAERETKRIHLEGEVTSPIDPAPGCRFASRCPYATARCKEATPTLKEVGTGHEVACFRVTGE